jgi:hypothetical protein
MDSEEIKNVKKKFIDNIKREWKPRKKNYKNEIKSIFN